MTDGQRRRSLVHHSLGERSWKAPISSRSFCWSLKNLPAWAVAPLRLSETVWREADVLFLLATVTAMQGNQEGAATFLKSNNSLHPGPGAHLSVSEFARRSQTLFFSSRNRRQLRCLPSCGAESITAGHAGKWRNKETMKWNEQKVGLMALRGFRMEGGVL